MHFTYHGNRTHFTSSTEAILINSNKKTSELHRLRKCMSLEISFTFPLVEYVLLRKRKCNLFSLISLSQSYSLFLPASLPFISLSLTLLLPIKSFYRHDFMSDCIYYCLPDTFSLLVLSLYLLYHYIFSLG